MTTKRPAGRKKSKAAKKVPLTEDDALALDDFCKDIHLDEVPLPAWEQFHACLDLTVPLFLTRDEAHQGAQKTVCFCRTVKTSATDPGQRKPATCLVTLPAQLLDGEILVLEGEGDRLGSLAGNLKVIIRIKASS